jgi:hypothetical protein
MATQAKNMTVKVEISRANPGAPVTFAFDDNPGSADRIIFENDDHPGFFVYFKIKDVNKTGLRFRLDPEEALRIDEVGGQPPANLQWPGFIPLSVENEGKKLIVYCRNEDEVEFKFTLRFRRLDGTLDKEWDPIGDGLDGPRGSF